MNRFKFPAFVQQLFTAGVISVLCMPLVGCVADDLTDVSQLHPYGGSKQHPIVIQNGHARVADCGDWSQNLADTTKNELAPNHGCAVQSNIAAMAAYPEDLTGTNRDLPHPNGDIAATAVEKLRSPN